MEIIKHNKKGQLAFLIAFVLVIAAVGITVAYNSGGPPSRMGHTASEISGLKLKVETKSIGISNPGDNNMHSYYLQVPLYNPIDGMAAITRLHSDGGSLNNNDNINITKEILQDGVTFNITLKSDNVIDLNVTGMAIGLGSDLAGSPMIFGHTAEEIERLGLKVATNSIHIMTPKYNEQNYGDPKRIYYLAVPMANPIDGIASIMSFRDRGTFDSWDTIEIKKEIKEDMINFTIITKCYPHNLPGSLLGGDFDIVITGMAIGNGTLPGGNPSILGHSSEEVSGLKLNVTTNTTSIINPSGQKTYYLHVKQHNPIDGIAAISGIWPIYLNYYDSDDDIKIRKEEIRPDRIIFSIEVTNKIELNVTGMAIGQG